MELNELFDQKTLDAILADAKASGIDAKEAEAVLKTLPNGGKAVPTRGASPEGELMSLLGEDQDAAAQEIAAATGVERSKVSSILMLAAPFLLKYLFSSGSSQSSGAGSLLGSLLGGGQTQQSQGMNLGSLLGLMGGAQPAPQQQNSLLGSLLGLQPQPVQQPVNNANTAALLQALMAQQQAQPAAPVVQPSQGADMGSLLNLMGGAAQPTQTQQPQQSGGGLMDLLFGLLGDTGK